MNKENNENNENILVSVIVVIYNISILESNALNSLINNENLNYEIIICDNSEVDNNNSEIAFKLPIVYIRMNGNEGLSRAYNKAINVAKGNYICIFDDDTTIDDNYFKKMYKYIMYKPKSIIIPIVMTGESIFSPVTYSLYHYKPIKNFNHINQNAKKISAINSGMMIPKYVFDLCRYNENIFLDCVDHDFIRNAKEKGIDLCIANDIKLIQDYSRFTDTKEHMLKRMKLFYKDYKVFCSDTIMHRIYCFFDVIFTKLRYTIKYKSFEFMK